ncbi:MAG TPA: PBP1A family penicillin-binding protein [Gaiellaceae bacterium]|nr:PBP1A family penicillin-binding protein [Gaiellaceae bacterium]
MSPSQRRTQAELMLLLNGRRRRRLTRRKRRRAALVVAVLVIGIPAGLAVAGFTTAEAFLSSCNLNQLKPIDIGQTSFLYAADGSLLGSIPAERHRQPVRLGAVSYWMKEATVAVEDRRFYTNNGVDYEGIARAFWNDVTAQKVVQGGSTLTQQLVRNIYIGNGQRTLGRKIKEACLAIKLSQKWTKKKILESWMNNVYFGSSAYGIEAAAEIYFSEHASQLSLKQAALLAGLPQAPSLYDPFVDPQAAIARRDVVLKAMLDTGAINQYQYDTVVKDRQPQLKPGSLYSTIHEPYFFNYVIDQLVAAYGANTVREGGLRVYTTIDPHLQRDAEHAITSTLNLKTDPASAIVAIDPRTGAIRAMNAVTPGQKGNQFNLAVQARRQPGSTFKTFVLTTAVSQGMNPATSYYVSAPFEYQPNTSVPAWNVTTYDHSYVGWISVENATLRSDNTVYAQLTLDVGPDNVVAMAHRLGITSPLQAVPSIGLGTIGVSPLEMASAYATLSAGGIFSRPMAITKVILANGTTDKDAGWGQPARKRVIAEGVAYVVTKILEENVQYGTGVAANIGRPAAGKTGTTDNHADAWFVGYTPTLDAAVWVGYPQSEVPMTDVHGIAVAGGTFPAQIWHAFMQPALASVQPQDWPEPKQLPTWKPFQRGRYALSYVPSYLQPTTTTTDTTPTETAPLPNGPSGIH